MHGDAAATADGNDDDYDVQWRHFVNIAKTLCMLMVKIIYFAVKLRVATPTPTTVVAIMNITSLCLILKVIRVNVTVGVDERWCVCCAERSPMLK